MIQTRTRLEVADNTGARQAMCIRVFGGSYRRYANIGDRIKVTIKEALPNSKVKKGEVYDAVVIRSRGGVRRSDGSILRFDHNAVVLLDGQGQVLGTRIFGPVGRELKDKYMKILSLATEVL